MEHIELLTENWRIRQNKYGFFLEKRIATQPRRLSGLNKRRWLFKGRFQSRDEAVLAFDKGKH